MGDFLLINQEEAEGEEEDEQAAYSHHQAEGVEADRDARHQFLGVLDVTISEVFHIFL